MKKVLSSTLIAATVFGGGVLGAGSLAGAAGAENGGSTVVDGSASVDVQIQDVDPEAPGSVEEDGERTGRRGRHGHHHRGGRPLGTVAEVLGLEVDDLKSQLQDGATVANIAGDQTDEVIDALVEAKQTRLDAAVEADRLTQEGADEKLAEVTERITDRVNNGRPDRGAKADGAANAEAT